MKNLKVSLFAIVTVLVFTGCGAGSPTFSLLPTGDTFKQSASSFNNELDILWVVDNSGSMAPLQANLVSNFNSFISNFQTLGYNYRMAVTATDAYKDNTSFVQYNAGNAPLSLFQDGAPGGTQSGTFVIIPSTPHLDSVFVTNATTGINGSGDERAFSSMMTTLQNPNNPAFLRSNSFFAIIILSDEDDFSLYSRPEGSWGNNDALDHCYVDSAMDQIASTAYGTNQHVSTCAGQTPPDSVNSYITALDSLTTSTGASRRYNVSTISVLDSACQLSHSQSNSESYVSIIGQRYVQLSQATNGTQGSICDSSYSTSLANIATQITTLSTQFYLSQVPQVSTIVVTVNGVTIPQNATNGWGYSSTNNAIQFFGTAVPAQGATISVNFVPQNVQNNG